MALNQQSRSLAIETPLGAGALAIRQMTLQERLSRPYTIELELVSEDGKIDFNKLIGQNATIRYAVAEKGTRYFNGFVSRFSQAPQAGGLARYRATLVPWLWLLTRTADCRIFQGQTVPEIIAEVFSGHGFSGFEIKLSHKYAAREYCVQYRETDFNFVSRLMEEEGIYYFFQHENGANILVLADEISAHQPVAGYETIPFQELEVGGGVREVMTEWVMEKEVQPGGYTLNDFDFIKPAMSLVASAGVTREHGASHFEIYDYPGEYSTYPEGSRLADVRLAELQAQHEVLHGRTTTRGIAVGHTFTLSKHPRSEHNREYLITGIALDIEEGDYVSGRGAAGTPAGAAGFTCTVTAIESKQPFRAPRISRKPVVQGPQTAIVVGPAAEEIHTDEHGRVKLQFHWDRRGKADENSSCWVRVSQTWAGKQWGAFHLPRKGQEVIVEFLEGDPDRPIVTGRVYNGESKPPYPLPDKKTISTTKSSSSKGGDGFNEIRFEDNKGEEQIFIHAEKNVDLRVKNDTFEFVGHDRHLVVKNDQVEQVDNDRHEKIKRDHIEAVDRDHHLMVAGKAAAEIVGSKSLMVGDDVIEVFEKNQSTQVTKNLYIKAENIVLEATKNITIHVGDSYIAIEADGIKIATNGEVVVDAKKDITQKSLKNVTVEATEKASLKGTAGLALESAATAVLKSPDTTVKGDGTVTIQGGLVKIN